MPGFEIFGDEEKQQVSDVLETGILFRYGFDNVRDDHWKAKEFEIELADRLQVKYTHLCSSGTAALSSALAACGIGAGDEVIVPPFTFVATIEAVLLAGAKPVFAEIDETLCLSPDTLDNALTTKTKAILAVHMCGSMARIDEIDIFCRKKGLILIEDTCQSLGGTFNKKSLGSFGQAGCFSFDFVKTITCGEGGAVITNSLSTYIAIDSFTDHGHDHLGNNRGAENHLSIGTNSRISELNAAVGLAQLRKLDRILKIQKNNKSTLKNALKGIDKIKMREIPDNSGDSATFLSFMLASSNEARTVINELNKAKIDGCFYWFDNKWHYIRQWNHIKALRSYAKLPLQLFDNIPDYSKINLPKSDSIMEKTISIQIQLGWDPKELERRAVLMASILKK